MAISKENIKRLQQTKRRVPTDNPFFNPKGFARIWEDTKKPMSWQELHDQAERLKAQKDS